MNDQSATRVNSIRPSLSGRLLVMFEPLTTRRQNPRDPLGSARRIDVASRDGEVTCQSDRGEMAMRWLEAEWSEDQTR